MKPTIITHEGGLRFAAQIRQHVLHVDQPIKAGGDDTAPTPIELLGASLGTCIAYYVQQFCHARGLSYEGMSVEVVPEGTHSRIERFEVSVFLPGEMPLHYGELLERVARSCPAHNTLVGGAEINVQISCAALESGRGR